EKIKNVFSKEERCEFWEGEVEEKREDRHLHRLYLFLASFLLFSVFLPSVSQLAFLLSLIPLSPSLAIFFSHLSLLHLLLFLFLSSLSFSLFTCFFSRSFASFFAGRVFLLPWVFSLLFFCCCYFVKISSFLFLPFYLCVCFVLLCTFFLFSSSVFSPEAHDDEIATEFVSHGDTRASIYLKNGKKERKIEKKKAK
ncbi:hypothetical protein CSUI_000601, partial [Cystoisospora suis]